MTTKRFLNGWKQIICHYKGHDLDAGDNLWWWDCQRCQKPGVGSLEADKALKELK